MNTIRAELLLLGAEAETFVGDAVRLIADDATAGADPVTETRRELMQLLVGRLIDVWWVEPKSMLVVRNVDEAELQLMDQDVLRGEPDTAGNWLAFGTTDRGNAEVRQGFGWGSAFMGHSESEERG